MYILRIVDLAGETELLKKGGVHHSERGVSRVGESS